MSIIERIKRYFNKRKSTVQHTESEIDCLRKKLPVLNYVPVDYAYSREYLQFYSNASKLLSSIIDNTPVDDLTPDVCDALVDSVFAQQLASAQQQFTRHLESIEHHKALLVGQIAAARSYLSRLEEDHEAFTAEIDWCDNHQA